jgi:hypothetical protein
MPTVWASAGSDAMSAGAVTAIAAAANQPNSLRREIASDMKTSYSQVPQQGGLADVERASLAYWDIRSGELGGGRQHRAGGAVLVGIRTAGR